MNPTLSRAVHFVLANGEHRSATVANAFGNDRPNLDVTLDLQNDVDAQGNLHEGLIPPVVLPFVRTLPGRLSVGSVPYDEDTKAPGTWHWAERE